MIAFIRTLAAAAIAISLSAVAVRAGEAKAPPPLKVAGTNLVDGHGQVVRLRGVNIASLEWTSDGNGHVPRSLDAAIHEWHANTIRLPLSQDRWFGHGPEQTDGGQAYRALVHQLVDYCRANGAYIILDLHWSDCNEWGQNIGQHSMPDTNSLYFWRAFTPLFANDPAVLFDLYNEPHDVSWDIWLRGGEVVDKPNNPHVHGPPKTFEAVGMQALLDAVRAAGARNVVVAGGLDWAYDFSGILNGHQLSDRHGHGVVYANHCYDNKHQSVARWEAQMEAASARLPVIVSEFGGQSGPSHEVPSDNWLLHVMNSLESHHWSWVAWNLHTSAPPSLIADWDYTPTAEFGVYVKHALADEPLPQP